MPALSCGGNLCELLSSQVGTADTAFSIGSCKATCCNGDLCNEGNFKSGTTTPSVSDVTKGM